MRAAARESVRVLGAATLAVVLRASPARVGLAVVYHRVDETGEDPARHLVPAVEPRLFEAQLRHLARCYHPVPASELLPAIESRRRGGRIPVAVTFDDDLETHARVAAPALARAGVPATFFVSGGGEADTRWWNDLQLAVDRKLVAADDLGPELSGALEEALARKPRGIHGVARAIVGLPPSARASVTSVLRARVAGIHAEPALTLADIRALAGRGFEIGFHPRGHPSLPALDDAALAEALTDGVATLEEACGRAVRTIAYPHGLADDRVVQAAARAGFEAGFTTTPEAIGPQTHRLLAGRIPPSFGALGLFAAAIALGLLRVVRAANSP